jgi:NADH:ubiquinone oxidoreductase subunit H
MIYSASYRFFFVGESPSRYEDSIIATGLFYGGWIQLKYLLLLAFQIFAHTALFLQTVVAAMPRSRLSPSFTIQPFGWH